MTFSKFHRIFLVFLVLAVAGQAHAYTSKDYCNAGLKLYSAKDYGKAAKYFSAALNLDPNNTTALQGRANCYYATGQYQLALPDYQRVQALTPSDQLAQFIIKVQEKAGASPASAPPPPSNSYFDQGVALFQQSQYAESVPLFQQACRQDPQNYKPFYYLAITQVKLGDKKDAALALTLCNLKHPSPAIEGYANQLKSALPPEDQLWVNDQVAAAYGPQGSGNLWVAKSPKMFGLRLEPAFSMVSLTDFETNAGTLQTAVSQVQVYDYTLSYNGSVPQGGMNIGLEPVMNLGNNLEIGLPLAVFSVGTVSDTIQDTSGDTLTDTYDISAVSVGLNLKYLFLSGDMQPYISAGGLVEPIAISYSAASTNLFNEGYSYTMPGNFSGMAVGGQIQLGLDYHLGDTFAITPFVGYQFASAGPLQSTTSADTAGNEAGQTAELEIIPTSAGNVITPVSNGKFIVPVLNGVQTPFAAGSSVPAGSKPVEIDLSGVKLGIGAAVFF
jgi:tetratricopeptide (TPR) repeat protein